MSRHALLRPYTHCATAYCVRMAEGVCRATGRRGHHPTPALTALYNPHPCACIRACRLGPIPHLPPDQDTQPRAHRHRGWASTPSDSCAGHGCQPLRPSVVPATSRRTRGATLRTGQTRRWRLREAACVVTPFLRHLSVFKEHVLRCTVVRGRPATRVYTARRQHLRVRSCNPVPAVLTPHAHTNNDASHQYVYTSPPLRYGTRFDRRLASREGTQPRSRGGEEGVGDACDE